LGAHNINATFNSDGILKLNLPTGETRDIEISPQFNGEIDFAFWDHNLRISLNENLVFNETLNLKPHKPRRNRMQFSVAGKNWILGPVQVERDLHYLPPRQNAAPVFEVTDGHYFMLGDNTQNSLDSRDWQLESYSLDDGKGNQFQISGDHLQHGSDPMFNNPRWNMSHDIMTFRDKFGNIHTLSENEVKRSANILQHAPLVPRHYLLGRALAVFMPLKPLAATNRFTMVQ
jgi:hypothetical protein